ncbi:hypothetical protein KAT36_04845 [Candidatus Pacearchaeota archaeon]|nr:hypothetical protein [Candidatus Pacearchaeota archaeon]
MVKSKRLSIKAVILSIAIALISVFFFVYAIQSIYPAPEYDDYCDKDNYKLRINSSTECEAIGGKWNYYEDRPLDNEVVGYCDRDFTCRGEYDDMKDVYERNVFFANLIIGIGVLVVGFLLALEAVSTGLMGGGVIMVVYGTIRYWGNLSDVWRTFVLGISLVILIWLGYKKLND